MPLTGLEFPILQHFFCAVEKSTGMPPVPLDPSAAQKVAAHNEENDSASPPKPLPKGVVLGPDGKPCRTCTSVSAWMAMTRQHKPQDKSAVDNKPRGAILPPTINDVPKGCPPDVDELGRSTWTLLHSITANYPEQPSQTLQSETKQFLSLFGKMYPCWVCADDFRAWMRDGNEPKVSNREEFGQWMCEAHNAVNVKLGKKAFDCSRWQERWRTGWKDGRCD